MLEAEEKQTEEVQTGPAEAETPTEVTEPETETQPADADVSQVEVSEIEIYEVNSAKRTEKVNSFINAAQDGSKILVNHQIQINLLELVDVTGRGVKFPSSTAIQQNNYAIIEELRTNFDEEIAMFANRLELNDNIATTTFINGGSPILAQSMPNQSGAATDSSN